MSEIEIVLERQWKMLKDLADTPNGLTLRELAERFDVSEKTIKRDVKSIESVFGKLRTFYEAHGRKRYLYDRQCFSFGLSLDRNELLAIYVGQNLMEPLRGTAFWNGVESGREKIKKTLRDDAVAYAERVAPFFYRFEPTERSYDKRACKLVDVALRALEESRVMRIRYRSLSSQTAKTYEMCPYNFVYWRCSVYLVGLCLRDRKIKIWKVDRLFDAETLDKKFKRPKDFDVEEYLANVVSPYVSSAPVVHATIRFTDYAARIVQEEKLKAVERIRYEKNGAIVVEMETEPGKNFIRWLLGFGVHAEILDPPELRDELQEEARALLANYDVSAGDPIGYYEDLDARATPPKPTLENLQEADDSDPDVEPEGESSDVYDVEIDDPNVPKPKPKRGRPRKYPRPEDLPQVAHAAPATQAKTAPAEPASKPIVASKPVVASKPIDASKPIAERSLAPSAPVAPNLTPAASRDAAPAQNVATQESQRKESFLGRLRKRVKPMTGKELSKQIR